jgi:nucleoside-diphosphate-sugar epimerase
MEVVENATHDWIYIDDFIQAIPHNTNIGTCIKTSNIEIIRMIEKIMGKELDYRAVSGMRDYDNTDWVCREPLKEIKPLGIYEGLEKTVKFYEALYG